MDNTEYLKKRTNEILREKLKYGSGVSVGGKRKKKAGVSVGGKRKKKGDIKICKKS